MLFLAHHVAWICDFSTQSQSDHSAWLDVWPFLPIVVRVNTLSTWDLDDLIAVLKAQRSRMYNSAPVSSKFAIGVGLSDDARTILGADRTRTEAFLKR